MQINSGFILPVFLARLSPSELVEAGLSKSCCKGFLAVVTFRFAGGMNWNLTLIVLTVLSFVALLFKTDILWVVVIGTGVDTAYISTA